uniref:Ycf53 n=1 Tax=Laurencia verruciformis TaxID=3073068 RepID=A0AA51RCC1_9FLOR|nr:Ycf53 [Laurencia verruciformis]
MKLTIEKNFTTINQSTERIINITYEKEQDSLLELIIKRVLVNKKTADPLDGFIYQKLLKTDQQKIKKKLIQHFPNGIATLKLKSCSDIDYEPLQKLLINENFKEADQLTNQHLCKLVKTKTNIEKKWLYFTDIQFLPTEDLFTLDFLWKIYSRGKFGFSVQKQIWIKSNKNWDILWEKISWTSNGSMKRYPQEFQWTIQAPEGHLPLFNQLRGTQTLSYLFKNITWE